MIRSAVLGFFFLFAPSVSAASTNSPEVIVISSLGMAIVVLIIFVALKKADRNASDPSNLTTADQSSLPDKLSQFLDVNAHYDLEIFRQSGNQERTISGISGEKLLSEVLSTMRRAKIDLVSISISDEAIQVQRLVHNGKGRQEGKRIGGFVIRSTDQKSVLTAERPIEVNFNTTGERLIGLAFRATTKHFDCKNDLALTEDFERQLFDCIDEKGRGSFTFKPVELASLLMFSNFIFTAEVVMDEDLAKQWEPHEYPNMATLLSTKHGQSIQIYELFGKEGLQEAQQFFEFLSRKLPLPIGDDYFKFMDLKF